MPESFALSGSLFFVKHSIIQFGSSEKGKQNISRRRFILGQLFHNFSYSSLRNMLKRESFVKLKILLDFNNTRV